jgi:hypothetical protein
MFCATQWTQRHMASHLDNKRGKAFQWGSDGWEAEACKGLQGVTRSYKDGLQPETLADGNWLVKQNQPVSKIETTSDTNLRSLYES